MKYTSISLEVWSMKLLAPDAMEGLTVLQVLVAAAQSAQAPRGGDAGSSGETGTPLQRSTAVESQFRTPPLYGIPKEITTSVSYIMAIWTIEV